MTYVLPQRPGSPVEYQVRFTSLDTLGGERTITLPETDIKEAIEACDHIRVNQETYQLPVDACIWCRTGDGSWQPWTGGEVSA